MRNACPTGQVATARRHAVRKSAKGPQHLHVGSTSKNVVENLIKTHGSLCYHLEAFVTATLMSFVPGEQVRLQGDGSVGIIDLGIVRWGSLLFDLGEAARACESEWRRLRELPGRLPARVDAEG
jgi:hypothetical protein